MFHLVELICDAVGVQKTLTCPEGQNILLYRPEIGRYARPCGADFVVSFWCRSAQGFFGTIM